MNIEEAAKIDDLINFTDREILRSAKYRCVRDGATPSCLVCKIKIGKMIFTIKISPEDACSSLDDSAKNKLAAGSINFLLARLRQGTGLHPSGLSN